MGVWRLDCRDNVSGSWGSPRQANFALFSQAKEIQVSGYRSFLSVIMRIEVGTLDYYLHPPSERKSNFGEGFLGRAFLPLQEYLA
jgi:hypothetical protein